MGTKSALEQGTEPQKLFQGHYTAGDPTLASHDQMHLCGGADGNVKSITCRAMQKLYKINLL